VTKVDYFGCPGPLDPPLAPPAGWEDYAALCNNVQAGATLFSGPRWRLKPNKFGQDLPGLEIPTTAATEGPCTPPPFTSALIKYEVGTPTTTVINLLDWDEEVNGPSPLSTSRGWVDSELYNDFIEIVDVVTDDNNEERQITSIGAPMSEDFDLTVYVKGDRKPVFIYDAMLVLEYDDEPLVPDVPDVAAVEVLAPAQVSVNDPIAVSFTVNNPGVDPVTADVQICGVGDALVLPYSDCSAAVVGATLNPGDTTFPAWNTTAPADAQNIVWTGTVDVANDPNPANNEATASTDVIDAPPAEVDVAAGLLTYPTGRIRVVQEYPVTFTVTNVGPTATPVDGEVCATGNDYNECMTGSTADLQPGDSYTFNFTWTPPDVQLLTVQWTGTATAAGDVDPSNDVTSGGTTQIRIPQ
jgi:hypothetical protein